MKRMTMLSTVLITTFFTFLSAAPITDEQVISLVDATSTAIETDATAAFAAINASEAPYKDPENPALYAFVYNEEVVIMAHASNATLVGRSYAGRPDVRGKKFRDEIVEGAIANGTGWVDYSYQKPEESGIHAKKAYYKLVTGSDGVQYIVCSGKYSE